MLQKKASFILLRGCEADNRGGRRDWGRTMEQRVYARPARHGRWGCGLGVGHPSVAVAVAVPDAPIPMLIEMLERAADEWVLSIWVSEQSGEGYKGSEK